MQQLDRDDTVSMCSEKHRGDADGIKSLENTSSHASTTSDSNSVSALVRGGSAASGGSAADGSVDGWRTL